MSKRFGLFPAPQKSSPRPSHRQGNLEDMASSSSGGQNDNTTVEEIYLPPPQPRTSTWQQNRTSIGSAATLDTTRRYTVDIPKTPRDQTLPENNKRRPKKSNLNLLARSSTVLCKLGLSEAEIKTQLENDRAELVRDLVRMPRRTRAQAIRSLAVSFEEKRGIRHRVLEAKLSKDSVKRTCCTDCSEQVSLALRRFWASLLSWCVRMQLWNGALKEIGGRFGTAVLTYFAFLKWLLMFNVSLLLFNFSFITVPEIIQAHNTTADNSTFKGLELLTGTGYFDQSIFFYGGYNGEMIKVGSYDMQLAYLFTMFTYMMLCGISIVYRLGKSVWRSVFANSQIGYGAWRFFCSWDFSILNEKAIHSFQKKIFVQIKESLADSTEKPVPTASDRLKSLGLHATAWFLYIALALISCTSVYYLATYNLEMVKEALHSGDLKSEAFFLLLPLLVSFINLVVPLLYALLSRIEHYENLRIKMYAGLLRDVLLKMSILGILCYYWLTDAPSEIPCWESFVGQDVYRMVITDFLFSVLGCVFGEYLCSLIGTKCLKNLKPPEFDITRNVLDLIYAQTLVWIGVYFSPLLPIIQIVKLFILFYMKKLSISLILRPSTGPGLAAEMKMAFVALLFFPSYIGSLFIVGYIIWRLKPSATCGPFQGFEVTMDAVSSWLESTDISAHRLVIQGQLLLLLVSSIMLIILCFLWQIVQDRKHLIIALREQIVNEGKDKAFLLEKLRTTQGLSPRPQCHHLHQSLGEEE
ncbi:transmembrane channel-like protein 5 isoform X2 [Engraulis encrasicolus]|uniref:transmembrane channel-like protein 5 isoform X2 n=1 Tax=Engraulis encrasicolus TaxID=184585 RepID=UPI002FCFF0A9